MFVAIWLGGPAAAAALLALVTRGRWNNGFALIGAGVVLAAAFVLVVYLHAPADYQHSQGDEDGGMFLGRWWEPTWVALLAFVGWLMWSVGVLAGLAVRWALGAGR